MKKPSLRTLVDLGERAVATFYESFFALLITSQVLGLHALKVAAVAGGIAAGKFIALKASAFLSRPDAAAPATDKPAAG